MKNDPNSAVPPSAAAHVYRYTKPSEEATRVWLRRMIAVRKPPAATGEIQDDLWFVPRSEGRKDGP
ncbi:MAG: hypothetical protein V4857_14585 [Pseudomonadota bacterium]